MAFAAKVALRRDGIVTDEGKIPAIGDSLIHELETEQFDEPAANYVRLAAGVLADRFIPLPRLECTLLLWDTRSDGVFIGQTFLSGR